MAKKDAELNKKAGERVRECRKLRKMTQQELEETIYLNSNGKYISMIETGNRALSRNLAHRLALVLAVSEEYLLCESDIRFTNPLNDPALSINTDTYSMNNTLFLHFLIGCGYNISFQVVRYLDAYDSNGQLELINASITQIRSLTFSNPNCKCNIDGVQFEAAIYYVLINGESVPYSLFAFVINRLYNYIGFTLGSIGGFFRDYEYLRNNENDLHMLFPQKREEHIETLKREALLDYVKNMQIQSEV